MVMYSKKKIRQNQGICHNGAFAVWFLYSKKEGPGLNCEYDGLSKVILTLSHSSSVQFKLTLHT